MIYKYTITEGSLEVKLPTTYTMWTDEKQRWEESEKRREEERISKKSLRRKKIQVREKVGKWRNTVFFQWFVAPEGREVGSLKRRVRIHLARWHVKNCTPLWREAHFQVKMYKALHVDHVSKLRCRKSARRCGATHISKSKCTKHLSFGALLQVAMSKKCTPLWREARFQVKMYKIPRLGALLEVAMSKKCTPLWREAHFEVKSVKTAGDGTLLDVQMSFRVAGARDCAPCQKWAKREAFVAFPKAMASAEEDLPRCIFRGRRSAIDMFIRDVRRSGRWFPERGCILRFAEMILRDRCSTSYDLASLFRGRRNTLDRWSGKIAKLIGTRPSALHSTFHFWRKSHKIVSFLMLSTSKAEEVSQTCFVFGVAKFRS